jgi:hypothetical protein
MADSALGSTSLDAPRMFARAAASMPKGDSYPGDSYPLKGGQEKADVDVNVDAALTLPTLGDGHHTSSPRSLRKHGRRARRLHFPDVGLAHESEIVALARVFHDFLKTSMPFRYRASGTPTYLDLYKYMDTDGSGTVDYEEFSRMVRSELHVHSSSLPDASLRALWNALDADASGALCFGEFAHFMRYLSKEDKEEGAGSDAPASPHLVSSPRPGRHAHAHAHAGRRSRPVEPGMAGMPGMLAAPPPISQMSPIGPMSPMSPMSPMRLAMQSVHTPRSLQPLSLVNQQPPQQPQSGAGPEAITSPRLPTNTSPRLPANTSPRPRASPRSELLARGPRPRRNNKPDEEEQDGGATATPPRGAASPRGPHSSSTYVNAGGVLMLSERDADSLSGVSDPYVRFLLVDKAARDAGPRA